MMQTRQWHFKNSPLKLNLLGKYARFPHHTLINWEKGYTIFIFLFILFSAYFSQTMCEDEWKKDFSYFFASPQLYSLSALATTQPFHSLCFACSLTLFFWESRSLSSSLSYTFLDILFVSFLYPPFWSNDLCFLCCVN